MMNKSETISYLKAYLDGDIAVGNIIPLRSILESAIKYLSEQPSLPSNLDEAAEEYDSQFPNMAIRENPHGSVINAFKAGAEWMAGQGVEAKVLQAFTDGSAYIECPYEGRSGDKVVVQIRKAK